MRRVDRSARCWKPTGATFGAHVVRARSRRVPAGWFGENIRISGLAVTDAVIGEQWLIGTDPAASLLLQVSIPREPCATFRHWSGQPRWVRRFTERGDTGAYLCVLRAGRVQAGDPIQVVRIPTHGVTVRELFVGSIDPERLELLLASPDLTPKARAKAQKLLARSGA